MIVFYWVVFYGRIGYVRLLVEKKVDLLLRDIDGKLLFYWVV